MCGCWRKLSYVEGKAEELFRRLKEPIQIYEYLDKQDRVTYGFETINPKREKVIKVIAL